MPRYTPTEHDRLVGARLRDLRKRRGETMEQLIENSGLPLKQSSVSRIELGERRLTEIEAAKIAAHYHVAVAQLLGSDRPFEYAEPVLPVVETEQQFLGNEEKPALFAVNDPVGDLPKFGRQLKIDLDNPMTPEQYRLEVWLPYLEARYANDQQKAS